MSPFEKLVILDNMCVSNLYLAGSLERVLTLWPFRVFIVPHRVFAEAERWREHGAAVCQTLNHLNDAGTIQFVALDEDSELEADAYAHLRLQGPFLGLGESESIAMAVGRDYIVATDDQLGAWVITQKT